MKNLVMLAIAVIGTSAMATAAPSFVKVGPLKEVKQTPVKEVKATKHHKHHKAVKKAKMEQKVVTPNENK